MGPLIFFGIIALLIYRSVKEYAVIKEKEEKKSLKRQHASRYEKHQKQSGLVSVINRFITLVETPRENYYAKNNAFKQIEKRQQSMSHNSDDVSQDEDYFGRVEDEESFVIMSPKVDDGEVYTTNQWENMTTQQIAVQVKQKTKRTKLQKAYILSEIFNKPKGLE